MNVTLKKPVVITTRGIVLGIKMSIEGQPVYAEVLVTIPTDTQGRGIRKEVDWFLDYLSVDGEAVEPLEHPYNAEIQRHSAQIMREAFAKDPHFKHLVEE